MTSEAEKAYVWVFLPGDTKPTLCGLFSHQTTAGGAVGKFVYGKSYLANPDALPIDPVVLPCNRREFSTTGFNGIPSALLDALPDDWGRYVIEKTRGVQSFPVGLMLNIRSDSVGNLAFTESANVEPDITSIGLPFEKLEGARNFILRLEDEKPIDDYSQDGLQQINTAMGGARPKLTVVKGNQLWLAKFPTLKDRASAPIAKIESASLKLAHFCEIKVAKTEVVHDNILLVRRFDRTFNGYGWARDSFLSARTILASARSSNSQTMGSYPRLAIELARYSNDPVADQKQLYRRMVFNVMIQNMDDHDRNHGLVADDEPGTYRLSPAYDIVPQRSATFRREHAMELGNGSSTATRENLLADCAAFGIASVEANAIIDSVQQTVRDNWRRFFAAEGLTHDVVEELGRGFCYLPNDMQELKRDIAAASQKSKNKPSADEHHSPSG